MNRGMLTPEIINIAKNYSIDLTTTGLRLLPYIDYVVKNGGKIHPERINDEDFDILKKWCSRAFINLDLINNRIHISKKFFHIMQYILWESYVETKIE